MQQMLGSIFSDKDTDVNNRDHPEQQIAMPGRAEWKLEPSRRRCVRDARLAISLVRRGGLLALGEADVKTSHGLQNLGRPDSNDVRHRHTVTSRNPCLPLGLGTSRQETLNPKPYKRRSAKPISRRPCCFAKPCRRQLPDFRRPGP